MTQIHVHAETETQSTSVAVNLGALLTQAGSTVEFVSGGKVIPDMMLPQTAKMPAKIRISATEVRRCNPAVQGLRFSMWVKQTEDFSAVVRQGIRFSGLDGGVCQVISEWPQAGTPADVARYLRSLADQCDHLPNS